MNHHATFLKMKQTISIYLYIYSGGGGFPCGSAGKESTRNAGDLGSIP